MKKVLNSKGFSLVEVLVTAGIIVTVTLGLFRVLIHCSLLSEMAGNLSAAVREAEDKLEEIRNTSFDSIITNYSFGGTPGNTFTLSPLNAMGIVYINSTVAPANADLLEIEIDVTWRNKDSRIVGEDLDLDGIIDAGEDVNPNNNKLDGGAKIVSYIARR